MALVAIGDIGHCGTDLLAACRLLLRACAPSASRLLSRRSTPCLYAALRLPCRLRCCAASCCASSIARSFPQRQSSRQGDEGRRVVLWVLF